MRIRKNKSKREENMNCVQNIPFFFSLKYVFPQQVVNFQAVYRASNNYDDAYRPPPPTPSLPQHRIFSITL